MTKKQKKILIRIIVATLVGVASYITYRLTELPVWAEILLFVAPYLVVGYDVILSAGKNIIHGQVFNEKFLMVVATVGAFVIREYPEAMAVMILYQAGELFQSIAVGKSRKSISSLMDMRPDSATVLRNGEEIVLSPEEVERGELLLVRPGEKIPLDGVIVEGETTVNQAALTGESLPVDKAPGENVLSGSINIGGLIKVRAESVYTESTVSKILALVENSTEKKAKAENFITKFAKYYTPAVVFAAVLLAVIPSLIDKQWSQWIYRALMFLVVSCPCALVISVPLSFFGGIGGASKKGVLVKGANYIELLAKTSTVILDKTGTVTKGNFAVSGVYPENGVTEETLLYKAVLCEKHSSHPIAKSVLSYYNKPVPEDDASVQERAGYGIERKEKESVLLAGNALLLQEHGISVPSSSVGTTVYVAENGVYLGKIVISDEIKPDSAAAVRELKELGVKRVVMLTGDSEKTASSVAEAVGIDEVKAGLLPDQKVLETEKILATGGTTLFVGDGINDAPVLTRADVGVAMGGIGSDAAVEAADVVLMNDNLSSLCEGIKISRKTMRIVRENVVFALGVKLVLLVLSAVGIANMWLAVFGDVGVAVLAILNAMRALRFSKK